MSKLASTQFTRILAEASDLIGSTTINGILYGIAFALYFFYARLLYPQFKGTHQQRPKKFMFVYASVMMGCGTVLLALTARVNQLAYINHRDFPGGPMVYQRKRLSVQPVGFVYNTCNVVLDLLTMGMQIWRLWVVWSGTQFIIVVTFLPIFLFLCFATMDIISIFGMKILPNIFGQPWAFNTLLGLQLAFTIVVTVLVIARLMLVRRLHIKLMGKTEISREYTQIVTMLIQSYAPESAWALAAVVSNASGSPLSPLFINSSAMVKIVACLLILYRVSKRRAWKRRTELQTSSLQWNRDIDSASAEMATGTSQALPDDRVDKSSSTSHLAICSGSSVVRSPG